MFFLPPSFPSLFSFTLFVSSIYPQSNHTTTHPLKLVHLYLLSHLSFPSPFLPPSYLLIHPPRDALHLSMYPPILGSIHLRSGLTSVFSRFHSGRLSLVLSSCPSWSLTSKLPLLIISPQLNWAVMTGREKADSARDPQHAAALTMLIGYLCSS